jgi:serine/threonine protein kinase
LALKFAQNESILKYLMTDQSVNLAEKWVRYWFRQILAGLIHAKKNRYSHLGLKLEKILLDEHL